MKRLIIIVVTVLLAFLAYAASISAPTVNERTVGTFKITAWKTLKMSEKRVEASGTRIDMRSTDGQLEAKAASVVVILKQQEKNKTKPTQDAVESVDLKGDVWIVSRPKPGYVTEARAAKAHIDWAQKVARLEGNVTITSTDPEMFAKPSQIKGDSATILLNKDLGPDEYRVTIESNPERSYMEVTPKAREQKESEGQ